MLAVWTVVFDYFLRAIHTNDAILYQRPKRLRGSSPSRPSELTEHSVPHIHLTFFKFNYPDSSKRHLRDNQGQGKVIRALASGGGGGEREAADL